MERDEKDLKKYKIVYLPCGKYMTKKVIGKIVDYVKNGGILVITDPLTFEYNIDGSSLANYREDITGVKVDNKTSFEVDKFKIRGIEGVNESEILFKRKSSIYEKIHEAYSVKISGSEVKVLGEFVNGKGAIFEKNYGNGKVIYFAANPMAPDILLIDTKIDELFRSFQKIAGTKTDRPIWKFLIPGK
ncbi:MAG: beta-galactosidase trimerization domain-containing protein [Candidatus Omnitrophica bacterium]|nr:beta-galactosidase trimerization domain-containing protein [Candidatus Omnitrophota bacterium]